MTSEIITPDEESKCAFCGEKALALVGLAIAAVFLYISIDVITDGGVTRALGLGGRPATEESDE